MTDSWAVLLDPLADSTRAKFERDFPEIPTADLCEVAVSFRLARQNPRASMKALKTELERLERAIDAAIDRLEHLGDDAGEALAVLTHGEAVGQRQRLISALRLYRSSVWETDNRLELTRGARRGEMPRLVTGLARVFERNGLPVDAREGGRFIQAVCIALEGAGQFRTTASQIKSLAGSIAYALEQNKEASGA